MRKAIVALSVSMLLSILGLEGVLRLLYEVPPDWFEPQIRHLRNPILGWVLPPNDRSFTIDAPVQTNSAGLRDDEIPTKKPTGEIRVLCLGDSFTFALGVRFEDLYVQRLERMLNERYGSQRFQVINAGVAGYNTRQELIYLLAEGFAFEPDLITVGFYWNDLLGNEDPLPEIRGAVVRSASAIVYERDGQHTLPYWLRSRLRRSLVLYLGVSRTKNVIAALSRSESDLDRVQRAILHGEKEVLEPFWKATAVRLGQIAAAAAARDIPVLLVGFPMENQVRQERPSAVFVETLRRVWAPSGMVFVDLEPVYRKTLEAGQNPFLPYDLHPGPVGMQSAADAVLDAIVERRLLPLRRSGS